MRNYRLTPSAEDDIRQIIRYTVDRWGIEQAIKYEGLLESCFSKIGKEEVFSRRFTKHPNLYVVPCQHHFVFFLKKKPVEIIAVLHERMDFIARLKHRMPK